MKQLRRFLGLTPSERHLLVSTALSLVAIRLALWVLPFGVLIRRVSRVALERDLLRRSDPLAPKRVAWAVQVASRYAPTTGNCFVQALAAQLLLARRGYPAQLRIGVAKDDRGRLKAHAWLECEGRVVIGGEGRWQFTPLPLKIQSP